MEFNIANEFAPYGFFGSSPVGEIDGTGKINPEDSDVQKVGGKPSSAECKTCQGRKYQDGSDEMVSFKSAAHMSPTESGAGVRAHEQEHVSNAYKKAAQDNGKVLRASVRIQTAVCPECGSGYVAGGVTDTLIKYSDEKNPYQKELKKGDALKCPGINIDLAG